MLIWLAVAVVGVVAFVSVNVYWRRDADRLTALAEKRREGSRVASRGELVDGGRHIAVAMALAGPTLFYENGDIEGSLDLAWVREVEYDTRLGTGTAVASGTVLRLRCYSQCFEFILPAESVNRWQAVLPARGGVLPDLAEGTVLHVALT